MRSKFIRVAVPGCLAAALWVASPNLIAGQQRESRDRGVIVSVSTKDDAPVTDMTAADFIVRENGVAREVVRVSPAPPPSHVVLLIDDSQALNPNIIYLRDAMTGFISKMAALEPAPQQQFMTFGERPTRRVDFTPNPEPHLEAAKKVFPITGSGAYFTQAITDAVRNLRQRKAASPVIVAFVSERGPE